MQKKAFVLQNKGMNRDLSVSKAGESSAYENHNIRILARDNDTMLSVTGERGNKRVILEGLEYANLRITEDEELRITEDELYRVVDEPNAVMEYGDFAGILIGWNVLNNHVVLFTNEGTTDRIYRVDYEDDKFYGILLFEGNLGFSLNNPIESVVYHETEDIQKIYWVDGKNVLRFMNFMAKPDSLGHYPWQNADGSYDNTYFDSNRAAEFGVNVKIEKDNTGNIRANGVTQYLITYYNKYGQETGYVWISDLVYLSPLNRGGAADETNTNSIKLTISNLDTRFSHFRVYSIFRSSLDGQVSAYLVEDTKTYEDSVLVVDDGAHLTAEDPTRLLFLGSKPLHAGTLAHKDQTLFLGDLQSVGHDFSAIESAIKEHAYYKKGGIFPYGTSACITFDYSDPSLDCRQNIPYLKEDGIYSYENQLKYTSSQITTFKGGEKYRFAIKFQLADGTESPAFWIGDKENPIYPEYDSATNTVKRAIAYCILPDKVVEAIKNSDLDIRTVQLCIAEATYADRSVKAQGIINPTMFNLWERYNKRIYSIPSWISRPRGVDYANRHFDPVQNASSSLGEIACNWWDDVATYAPKAYYRYKGWGSSGKFEEDYPGIGDYDFLNIVYILKYIGQVVNYRFEALAYIVRIYLKSSTPEARSAAMAHSFTEEQIVKLLFDSSDGTVYEDDNYKIVVSKTPWFHSTVGLRKWSDGPRELYAKLAQHLINNEELSEALGEFVDASQFAHWFGNINEGWTGTDSAYHTAHAPQDGFDDFLEALNYGGASRWLDVNSLSGSGPIIPAFYQRQYMFVDENVVTLNSPELDYEAVSLDGSDLKLRIVGVAKISSGMSDYTIDATPGKLAGRQIVDDHFSWATSFGNRNGLLSWPLWKEKGLDEYHPDDEEESDFIYPEDIDKRTSENYVYGGTVTKYWMHMWARNGNITGYEDKDNNDYNILNRKVFANLKYAYETKYCAPGNMKVYIPETGSLRHYDYLSSQYVQIGVGGETKYYNGNVQQSISIPGKFKYPIFFTTGEQDTNTVISTDRKYLYTQEPILLEYLSSPHVVMSLGSRKSGNEYIQNILPYVKDDEDMNTSFTIGSHAPWLDDADNITYKVSEERLRVSIADDDCYLFIGELYNEFTPENDTRYGGTTDTDIANCRFVTAGPQFLVSEMKVGQNNQIYANQGDTYFQRWDCLKTKPYSNDSINNVIDVTSVMVETHINIDGRTDLYRGISELASIDTEKFGSLNRVYSQKNNYQVSRDLGEDDDLDEYRSSLTWTLAKTDAANVDEWTHITLASTLKLDGDKGICQAIRRFNNSLIAFQDRGISEILFNSRTQLSTQDGVPVEIANSGKVDGKRYITNKYGCTNKWSIVEGKSALYFVDNINKAFCGFNGSSMDNISSRLGFSVWFRNINDTSSWKPVVFNNLVAYYDRIHSDVYLVRAGDEDNDGCLVYNEPVGAFTSFFDYYRVPMMVNVEDRFVSYRNHALWLQNEGFFCNFFGEQYDAWAEYRVTPEPYSDKVWTNLEYRTDFYRILDSDGNAVAPEEEFTSDRYYLPNVTYDYMRFWNEYQTTADEAHYNFKPEKKFRLWRLQIPRAIKEGRNKFGLDRIRNPWMNLIFKKRYDSTNNTDLMQIHDITAIYYE